MESKKNIVMLMTAEGPVIGELAAANEQEILLSSPMLIGANEEGGIDMINYMSFLVDPKEAVTFFKFGISSVCTPNPVLVKEYEKMTTSAAPKLIVPDNKIIV